MSDSSCDSLDGSCLWEIYTFPDTFSQDTSHDKVLQPTIQPAKFSVTSLPKISTPNKKSSLKFTKTIKEKSTQTIASKAKSIKKEKITDYFCSQFAENSTLKNRKLKRHNSMVETGLKQLETTPTSKRLSSRRLCVTEPRPKRKLECSPIRKFAETTPIKRLKNERELIVNSDDDSIPFASTSFFYQALSSSENFSDKELGVTLIKSRKTCVSCGTHRTPIWRDIDENTPLCNTCGISWKKSRIRCTVCWYVPLTDLEVVSYCSNCNNFKTLKKFNSMRRYKSSVY